MASLTPTTLISSHDAGYPAAYAQVKQSVAITTGINNNKLYRILAGGTLTDLGITMASNTGLTSTPASGANTGTFRYRARWYDSVTKTWSLASDELTVTLSSQKTVISKAGLTAPASRVTHWILERTTNGGKVFFPVNYTSALPNGTVIATDTFEDTVTDSIIRQRTALRNSGGIPSPYRYCYAHKNRVWMVGGQLYTITVVLTNGAATCTSAALFNSNMAGWYMIVPTDTGNTPLKVLTYNNSSSLTLASNYTGTGGSVTAMFFSDRNKVAWSDAGTAEHFGTQEVGGLSNEITIGAAGETLVSGCGIGSQGELLAMETGLYFLSWTDNPDPLRGDGRVVPIPTRRGVVAPKALKYVDNWVYGMDHNGIWRMRPNGLPEDISAPLKYDFQRGIFNSCSSQYWHIQYDQKKGWVKFYVNEGSDTYPKKCFVWDTQREKWVTTIPYPLGVPCGTELRDTKNHLRNAIAMASITGSATAGSVVWCDTIGKTRGVNPGVTPLTGTISSTSSNTVTVSTATFPTTGEKLIGVPARLINAAGTSYTDVLITNNTGTVLTLNADATAYGAGDALYIGHIPSLWRTPVLDAGAPDRKKKWTEVRIPIKYKTASTLLYMKAYLDRKSAADSDQTTAFSEDGLVMTASSAVRSNDPTVFEVSYRFPLNGVMRHTIQLEFYSNEAGAPWEINGPIKVYYELDDAEKPREHN